MKVFLSGDVYIVVLEAGDNVFECLRKFAEEHDFCGFLTGIGALENVKIAYFDKEKRKYSPIELEGGFELTSIVGNIGRTEEGDVIIHCHVTLGDKDGRIHGGHLIEAVVSVTMELFCVRTKCFVRRKDDKTGLLLIHNLT